MGAELIVQFSHERTGIIEEDFSCHFFSHNRRWEEGRRMEGHEKSPRFEATVYRAEGKRDSLRTVLKR